MRQSKGVRLGVLGVIAAHPGGVHGYGVRKQWEKLFGALWRVGLSEVYHALGWLVESGWIEDSGEADATVSARRKIYRITDAGRHSLTTLALAAPPEDAFQREFAVKLLFCIQHLDPDAALRSIEGHRDFCQDHLHRVAMQRRRIRRMAIDPFFADLALDNTEALVRAEIAWLDNLCHKLKQRFGAISSV
jgi:DNA-binding PadR family transcriptional regulator